MHNNFDKCYLLINGHKKVLQEFFSLYEYFELVKKILKIPLEIKLIENKKMIDMSYMLYNCTDLISLSNISKWDTKNVEDMSYIFANCESLRYI